MEFKKTRCLQLDNYCMLDLETTGLSPQKCEIIEVGILKIRNRRPVEKMEVLVCPSCLPIPASITKITGITTEMVIKAPDIEAVAPWIWDFIGDDVIAGYNVRFDLSFLALHTRPDHLIPNPYLDVLPLARRAFPDLPRHSLSAMTRHLHLYQNTHRAIDDCIAAFQLYEIIKKRSPHVLNLQLRR